MAIADFGGGVQQQLQRLVAQRIQEQEMMRRAQEEQAKLALQSRGLDLEQQGLTQRGDQFTQRMGLDRDELGFKREQYAGEAPQREAQTGYIRAQTGELQRRPLAEQQDRDFTLGRDQTQHKYRLGEIGAQGANALSVAQTRPRSPMKVNTVNEQGKPVTRLIDPATQEVLGEFPAAPSAMERMDEKKFSKAAPVLGGIAQLSERINVLQGVAAKATGAVERQKAQLNLNDDIAEYESLISGFTPLVARALGHTGVLTEQDVQSVRKLFPAPGDSKSLRDRKITRIQGIMSDLEGGAAQPAGGGGDPYTEYLRRTGGQ